PHHTNEIAQSAAASSDAPRAEDFAQYWIHNGFLNVDDEKMSKSLGNFSTVEQVLSRFDAEALRLFLLGTHYRRDMNFTDGLLEEAERRVRSLYETLDKADRQGTGVEPPEEPGPAVEASLRALDDDFNTPQVLAVLAEVFTQANALADRKGKRAPPEKAALSGLARDVRRVGAVLGILQRPPGAALLAIRARAAARRGIDPGAVEARIAERAAARAARDFTRGDTIRGELLRQGVVLMDGPGGTTWAVD
ncbi:MAG TPA: DALR domain-containing protein, partial [Anaeromyxobacter sp.]|nr:DALR domain-containing protein [Anaeromyxobacter sp.]